MKYWLFKSEPDAFSIDDLMNCPNQSEHWDGVRNYQARNFMRDEMKMGDRVLFYHSSCKTPGIVGLAKVVREAYPDHTSWNPNSKYYDSKCSEDNPRWYMVDIQFESKLNQTLSLQDLKEIPGLEGMALLRKGMRLSIQPVKKEEFELILSLVK